MARSARCDVRRRAAVFVGSDETDCVGASALFRRVSSAPPERSSPLGLVLTAFARFLEIGGANIAGADRAFESTYFVPQLAAGAGARCARAIC